MTDRLELLSAVPIPSKRDLFHLCVLAVLDVMLGWSSQLIQQQQEDVYVVWNSGFSSVTTDASSQSKIN